MDERTIEDYLAAVEQQLPGSSAVRRDVLDEVRDGLLEAREQAGQAGLAPEDSAALAAFGDPRTIGAALAHELRLRLARRRAKQIVVVFASLNVGWLAYRSGVGFSATLVPDEAAGAVFLHAVDALRTVGWVALVGGLLLTVATSRRVAAGIQVGVAAATLAATALATASGLVAIALVDQPSAVAMTAGAGSAVVLMATVACSYQVLHHLLMRSEQIMRPASPLRTRRASRG